MENIKVGLRVRPLNYSEKTMFEKTPWLEKQDGSFFFDYENYANFIKNTKSTQINLSLPLNFSNISEEFLKFYNFCNKKRPLFWRKCEKH